MAAYMVRQSLVQSAVLAGPATETDLPSQYGKALLRLAKSLTSFLSFLLAGALLEALSANKDRAPDGLQHGLRHVGGLLRSELTAHAAR